VHLFLLLLIHMHWRAEAADLKDFSNTGIHNPSPDASGGGFFILRDKPWAAKQSGTNCLGGKQNLG
jgi:hypothetical protein